VLQAKLLLFEILTIKRKTSAAGVNFLLKNACFYVENAQKLKFFVENEKQNSY
jgi:hypothetical protein